MAEKTGPLFFCLETNGNTGFACAESQHTASERNAAMKKFRRTGQ